MRNLSEFIAVYDNALSAELCSSIISDFHDSTPLHARNGAGVRDGLEDSGWTELNVSALADSSFKAFFDRLIREYFERYNAQIRLSRPISPIQRSSDLMMKQYRADLSDRFEVHFDSIRAVSNRYLVFLWYLNDVPSGGETWFPDLDIKVAPKAGRLLMFPPYWMFQHAGLPPVGGDKYILSTYALY